MPFDPTTFLASYPQFVGQFSDTQLTNIYTYEALTTGSKLLSLFKDTNAQNYWSQVVLAHILTIYTLGLTGRVTNVTEGSVSGQFENIGNADGSWWNKTMYGQQCWKLIQSRGGATLIGTCGGASPFTGNIFGYLG